MPKIKKSLCKIKKEELKDISESVMKIISKPKYFCQNCLRSSSKKKFVCKPKKIDVQLSN